MSDFPDYTYPVSIAGQKIETVAIDIKASSIGNVPIKIEGVESGIIFDVKITNTSLTVVIDTSGGPVDVHIKSQETALEIKGDVRITNATLDVNVINSTLNVNVGSIPFETASENILENPGFETGDLTGWYVNSGTASIETSIVKGGSYSAKITPDSGKYAYFLTSKRYPCQPGQVILFTGWVYREANIDYLTVRAHFYTNEGALIGTVIKKISDIEADTWTAFKLVAEVPDGATLFRVGFNGHNTDGVASFYVDSLHLPRMALVGHSAEIPVNINIASQSVTMDVNIKAQEVTLNVKVEGTANVNIANAEVYLNVSQDEVFPPEIVTEDSTPSNYVSLSANTRYGFFVKNVRCFIAAMWIWFRNNSGSDITVTVRIKLEPDGPTLREGTKTIPNGTDGFVQIIGGNGIWAGFWNNYDVLFFEIIPESDGLEVGTGTAKLHYYTGSYWTGYYTIALKINRWGIGKGIIPISGTVNTIQIPNVAADTGKITFSLGANESKTFTIVEGTGRFLQLRLFATHQYVSVVIYCDGEAAFYTMPDIGACVFAYGHESGVPYFVAKRVWTISEGWGYIIFINLPLAFRRKLEVKVTNNVTSSVSGHFHVSYEVIK